MSVVAVPEFLRQETSDFFDHVALLISRILTLWAQTVVETGNMRGDSTRILAAGLAITGGTLYSIDIDSVDGKPWYPHFHDQYPQHQFLTSDSRTVPWERPIDLLLLDSDHHYDHVLAELKHLGPFVRHGGYLLVHDSGHESGDALGDRRSLGTHVLDAIQDYTRPLKLSWHHHHGRWGMAEIPIP